MWEIWVQSLGQEDPLEKGMANHSSIFAWRIPWTEEPGGLQSMGSQRVRHNWATSIFFQFLFFKPPSSKQPKPNHAGFCPASTLLPPLHGSTSGNIWLFSPFPPLRLPLNPLQTAFQSQPYIETAPAKLISHLLIRKAERQLLTLISSLGGIWCCTHSTGFPGGSNGNLPAIQET